MNTPVKIADGFFSVFARPVSRAIFFTDFRGAVLLLRPVYTIILKWDRTLQLQGDGMICEQCGTGIPAGIGFCPECGSAVKAPEPEATFKFACPHCRQRIRVARSRSGNRGHCPACRRGLVIPVPGPESAPPEVSAPEPALRPAPVGRPVLRAVPADESGEPDAVLRPLPPKNMPQALPGYMCSERSARVSPGMLIALIAGAAGLVLAVGLLLFFLFR